MILRDPVHGLISFETDLERLVVHLIDTREVQRLRRIRALGPASLAFPGAEHSRFAHAVGSAHVMKRYLDRVGALSRDIPAADRIDGPTAKVALAAALLHDLGHGPYSHSFEHLTPDPVVHETWTSRMLLDPETQVHQVLAGEDPALPVAVERLVHGVSPIPHLARAVSGTFDVDRCDYLMRDSHMTGVRYGLLDLEWLLQSLRLHRPEGAAAATLAVDGEKGLTAVEGFFLARLYMYRQVYLHKAVRAAELVLRALFRRVVVLGVPDSDPALTAVMRGEVATLSDYLTLDDHALHHSLTRWERAADPILADLSNRIRTRRLFKSIPLRPDAPAADARARLGEALVAEGFDPEYYGAVDRVETDVYTEDDALAVLQFGRRDGLLDASQVLRELSRQPFVQYRAFFPDPARDRVRIALSDLT